MRRKGSLPFSAKTFIPFGALGSHLRFVPFGAPWEPRWGVECDARELADQYEVSEEAVSGPEPAEPIDRELVARDALAWRLVRERGLSVECAATLMQSDPDTVRAGVASHKARLAAHRAKNAA